jgi:hypothetical protein
MTLKNTMSDNDTRPGLVLATTEVQSDFRPLRRALARVLRRVITSRVVATTGITISQSEHAHRPDTLRNHPYQAQRPDGHRDRPGADYRSGARSRCGPVRLRTGKSFHFDFWNAVARKTSAEVVTRYDRGRIRL